MFPVKLTDHRYINPDAIADVEYIPKGRLGDNVFFTVLFLNNQLDPVQLKGEEADEAFANWTAAVDDRRKQADMVRDNQTAKLARSSRSKA